jgi:hypothetical protein
VCLEARIPCPSVPTCSFRDVPRRWRVCAIRRAGVGPSDQARVSTASYSVTAAGSNLTCECSKKRRSGREASGIGPVFSAQNAARTAHAESRLHRPTAPLMQTADTLHPIPLVTQTPFDPTDHFLVRVATHGLVPKRGASGKGIPRTSAARLRPTRPCRSRSQSTRTPARPQP